MAAEETKSGLTAFDSDGFTVGSWVGTNKSGDSHVAWNWKANGSDVLNENGTIDSQVSANTDAGFSIVSWANPGSAGTIGHGLNSKPELIISKMRSAFGSWFTHSKDGAATQILRLETANAFGTHNVFNNTYPTNSVFSYNHGDAEDFIAYCFHSVEGYSKVGSYTGNGSSDGTFVYTGFRPKYVMTKVTSTTDSWMIFDDEREPYNLADTAIFADTSGAESTSSVKSLDIVSNGFKLRGTDAAVNGSGHTYIYLCFAEHPFKHTNAR